VDTLIGGQGDDTYVIDSVDDVVVEEANQGTDLVRTSASYALSANVENIVLTGTVSISAMGNALNNKLDGNAGANLLDGGAGADTMNGGAGDDTYVVDNASDMVTESSNQGADKILAGVTYTLGSNVEQLQLTGSSDINGTGNTLANVLTGNAGANVLTGGTGNDTMIGGIGNDIYVVDATTDVVTENVSEGTDTVQSSVAWTLGANVENLTLTGTGGINGTGNSLANMLTGNAGANRLDGGASTDTMAGGAGNDIYVVDNAADVVTEAASGGTDSVESIVTWTLGAEVENLTLTGSSSINGTGNSVANTLRGNTGNNTLDGSAGNDTLIGGAGDDSYVVDATTDVVTENVNEGTDTVTSSVTYALGANVENLTLSGTSAINATGNTLNNVLTGNAGNNRLDGGTGADTMAGGAGNDTYVVDNAADLITELAAGGLDTVEASLTWTLGTELENLTLTGTAAINGKGNALGNVLTGNASANRLDGAAGDDTMMGGAGDDIYVVDSVADVVTEAALGGIDKVESSISWTLGTGVENLTLTGSAAINGTGNSLANTILGNSGDNVLNGGAGNDTMSGGSGNDTYVVDVATDVLGENANEGVDLVQSAATWTLAANFENLTLTGSAAVNATGNAAGNVLNGNASNNRLDGGSGADTMIGGTGNDTYVVDNASDVINEVAAGGIDTVESGLNWTLGAELENLTLTGTSAINSTGNALANVLTGNAAGNVLDGGLGNDTLVGGAGNDTYIVDSTSDVVTEAASGGTDTVLSSITLTLAAEVESLTLTGVSAINGTGNALANTLRGNSANNVLSGAAGADTMIGGAGDDTYVVDATGDVITELVGEGTDVVQASVTYTLAANVENLTLAGTTAISGTGNTGNNVLTGNSAANTLTGGAGNDTLDGGTGTDSLVGGAGDDTYVVDVATDVVTELANEGVDTVRSGVTLTLGSNVENLILTGTAAINGTGNTLDNVLTGNSANNTLTAGAGNDTLDGGAGTDTMVGGAGNDMYVVDVATDVVTELANEGTDTVVSAVTWTLAANLENLSLSGSAAVNGTGNASNNALSGNSGANSLSGAAGIDTLDGAAGNDTLNGGIGADTYMFGRGYGADIVIDADATAGVKDVVQFGAGIASSDIVFTKNGNALVATIRSTTDTLSIQDWYLSTQNRVEEFRFVGGTVLTDVQAQALVGAMAAFSPSGPAIVSANQSEMTMSRAIGIAVSGLA
jgi:Ca2+-binding RTX toxin-like protein